MVRLGNPHQAAAMTYGGLGLVVIAITFVARLVPASRVNPVAELSIGAVFLVIFAVLIYRGWWPISAVLILSNSWRVFTYLNDGRGSHIEMLPFSITQIESRPIAFVNAVLMAVIVFMLARSAWTGFSVWQAARRERLNNAN